MPFQKLDPSSWEKVARRVLVIGPPNSRKTSSLTTWPRPIHVLVFPGEKGSASIPINEPGVHAYVWEQTPGTSPHTVWKEVQAETKKILSGAYGECRTFAGDGLHKLYQYLYEVRLADLVEAFPDSDQDKLGGRAYGLAHKAFLQYLTEVCQSNVENVVFTCWSAREKDNPEDKRSKSHIWPDLPGQLAQWVLGEFAVVLYAEVGLPLPDGTAPATWQLRPAGVVAGVGVKGPVAITAKLPSKIKQSWAVLEPLLLGQTAPTPNPTPHK